MNFEPMNFVKNLNYRCLGMLGIFVAIGVIALSIIILNAISNKKDK